MRVLGIDLGSRAVKIVVMEENNIIHKQMISTMSFYRDYCYFDGKLIVDLNRLGFHKIDVKISTGYGRNNTNLNEFIPINEVKAHVYGGIFQTGWKNFILLDIGGQDVKIAKVEKGIITDLDLNDKCAASCGRYLENMANVLEVSVEDMSRYYKEPVELNSTCAVFSESELIGKIAEGISLERLCASINYSLYQRVKPLLSAFPGEKMVLTGGVANNQGLSYYLSKHYEQVITVQEASYNGAIGCCYYGLNFIQRSKEDV